ncbi:metal-dependent hydrolase family protein [Labedaea rhizosphaerae]|uniref:Imidazolonepropionase-like amidohydrolase n=1 Tax=Labedaea rhizosphaerae TaxID=598644 RepID=A0A4R6RX15_LABRH|nr:amidohydrolase family protein [Labedaea rhizosphaerae]TDP91037.1 imidazolonepropionase-like amidohydrolase [Labedaea rhizosphaerae]
MADLVLRHVDVVHPATARVERDRRITLRDGRIAALEADDTAGLDDAEFDGTGLFALPGLIDCHVHVNAMTADLGSIVDESPAYVAARASQILRGMLERGFTTVRDVGGADFGLAAAVDEGIFAGPRIFFCGKALSQTGGHGDGRPRGRDMHDPAYTRPVLGRIADGVAGVRAAARDEIRRGAHHLKVMISGGCASPTDRIDSLQFSDEELRAIVDEAARAGLYCAGHAYTAAAVNRGLALGFRSIEHGNLLDETSIELFLAHDAFYVPTLITYVAQVEAGAELDIAADQLAKVDQVLDGGLRALELADRAGVKIAFGTDLLGAMHRRQCDEFRLRAKVQRPEAVLRGATTIAAELLRRDDLGVFAPGAVGDVVLARGNPLADVELLADPGRAIAAVVKDGRLVA